MPEESALPEELSPEEFQFGGLSEKQSEQTIESVEKNVANHPSEIPSSVIPPAPAEDKTADRLSLQNTNDSPSVTSRVQQSLTHENIDVQEERLQVLDADLKTLSQTVTSLNNDIRKLTDEMRSSKNIFAEQIQKNQEAFEQIASLLQTQKTKIRETATRIPEISDNLKAEQNKENEQTATKIKKTETVIEKPAPDKETMFHLSIDEEPPVLIEPTLQAIESSESNEGKSTLPIIEEIAKPATQEKTPPVKSPLKLKGPKDIEALQTETLSPRKGPVWPI